MLCRRKNVLELRTPLYALDQILSPVTRYYTTKYKLVQVDNGEAV